MIKRLFRKYILLNITLVVMLVTGAIFTLGFGISLYLARNEVTKEVSQKIEDDMDYILTFVDDQLQRVEDVGYTFASSEFGKTIRTLEDSCFVGIDPTVFVKPTEEEVYQRLEHFLEANPLICGAAVGFEDGVYPDTKGEYGFAAYVTRVSGKMERLRLGEIHDFHQKEWYKEAAAQNKAYWSRPFRETSMGKVVACFSIPLHGYDNRMIGVMAIDIDTEMFRSKCREVVPMPGAEVALVDRDFHFICHPDTSLLLKSVEEVKIYDDYKTDDSMKIKMLNHEAGKFTINDNTSQKALFFFKPIIRTGWTLSVECSEQEIYKGVDRMKRDTTWIAFGSIFLMAACFLWLFRKIQKVTTQKAGIERDLQIASAVQMSMIPKLYPAFPDRKELDVCGLLKPARSVGGDLYDYFIKDNKFFFVIGDVSGKGVPASLFMVVIRALFRNITMHVDHSVDIVSSLNDALSENNEHNMFSTLFVGVLNLENGHLDYCNAGHNAPVVRKITDNGEVDVHYATPKVNIAVGVIGGFPYVAESATMKEGEAIFLFTDGVTEAENAHQDQFGEENLLKALAEARSTGARTSKDFIDSVFKAVEKHAQGAEQSDDITMLVVEYKKK